MDSVIRLKDDNEVALTLEIEEFWKDFTQPSIDTQDEYQMAADRRTALKSQAKQLEDIRKGHTRPIDELKKQVMSYFGTYEELLTAAQLKIDGAMLEWNRKLQKQREEEQRKLEEHTRQKEAEARAKLEAAAVVALEKGDEARAISLVEKAEEVSLPVPILAPVKPIAQGVTTKKNWKWRYTDKAKIPDAFWIVDEARITKLVKGLGENAQMEGIEVYCEEILSQVRR